MYAAPPLQEAERIPATLASELEGICERVSFAALVEAHTAAAEGAASPPRLGDAAGLHGEVLRVLEAIIVFAGGLGDDTDVLRAVSDHSLFIAASLSAAGQADAGSAVLDHAHELRSLLARMHVIRRTDFLESGTALAQLLVYITMGLAVFGSYDEGEVAAIATIAIMGLQFLYTMELLADIGEERGGGAGCSSPAAPRLPTRLSPLFNTRISPSPSLRRRPF